MRYLKTEHSGSKKGRGAFRGPRQEAKQLSRKHRRIDDKLTHQRLIELGLEAPKSRSKKKPKGENAPEYFIGETIYIHPRREKEAGLLEVRLVDCISPSRRSEDYTYFGIVQRTTKRSWDYLVGHLRQIETDTYFGDEIIGKDPAGFEIALKHKA
ncbi:hypothetical protein FBR05_04110 [Deltaproteobacteria bacterium PRO3]|nr:hypothetical protein [Deltaproteobacteria bacterium PRO3]